MIARCHQREPKFVVAVGKNSVREAWQIVDEDVGLSLLWPVQPGAAYPIDTGLNPQHERLIWTDSDAVCKIKIVQNDARRFCFWIVCEKPSVGLVLQQIRRER